MTGSFQIANFNTNSATQGLEETEKREGPRWPRRPVAQDHVREVVHVVHNHSLRSSFSAGPTPIFASIYAFFNIFQDLQENHLFENRFAIQKNVFSGRLKKKTFKNKTLVSKVFKKRFIKNVFFKTFFFEF